MQANALVGAIPMIRTTFAILNAGVNWTLMINTLCEIDHVFLTEAANPDNNGSSHSPTVCSNAIVMSNIFSNGVDLVCQIRYILVIF